MQISFSHLSHSRLDFLFSTPHAFRLAGRDAYLISFLDDYSRHITSLNLYRSQSAAHVLETYRRGIAEYGVPLEMLTDNGRQYNQLAGHDPF